METVLNGETQQKQTITISIFGSCVSRDTFEICKQHPQYVEEDENIYVINRYVHNISPFSAMSKPVNKQLYEKCLSEFEYSTAPKSLKRNLQFDMDKRLFEYMFEVKSEWLIIDLSASRFKLKKISNNGQGNSFVTDELLWYITRASNTIVKGSALYDVLTSETVDPYDFDDKYIKNTIKAYIKEILNFYPEERIIVIEPKHSFTFINKERSTFYYRDNVTVKPTNKIV